MNSADESLWFHDGFIFVEETDKISTGKGYVEKLNRRGKEGLKEEGWGGVHRTEEGHTEEMFEQTLKGDEGTNPILPWEAHSRQREQVQSGRTVRIAGQHGGQCGPSAARGGGAERAGSEALVRTSSFVFKGVGSNSCGIWFGELNSLT